MVKLLKCFYGIMGPLLTILVTVTSGTVTDGLPQVSADFVPAIRFVVFTDTHNKNERVAKLLDTVYAAYDEDKTYPGIDAVCCLGDFSNIGEEVAYDKFLKVFDEHLRPETKLIAILGNHEVKEKKAREWFRDKFQCEPDHVETVNGFRFIAISSYPYITEWSYPPTTVWWAKNELQKAEKASGDKAIFTLQHPHNFGTVYGSTVWCSPELSQIWKGHASVVNFSGHSHYPACDPRSINQSTYTAVGCGGMAYFEVDKNYLVNQHPGNYEQASEYLIVEADHDGSVRIQGFDLRSGTQFSDYYIDDVKDTKNYTYTYKNMRAQDTVPVFPEKTEVTAQRTEKGDWTLSFDQAESRFIVHDYKLKIKDQKGKTVVNGTFVDDYFYFDGDGLVDFTFGADTFESGKTYSITLRAVSAYHKKSVKVTRSFTAQ